MVREISRAPKKLPKSRLWLAASDWWVTSTWTNPCLNQPISGSKRKSRSPVKNAQTARLSLPRLDLCVPSARLTSWSVQSLHLPRTERPDSVCLTAARSSTNVRKATCGLCLMLRQLRGGAPNAMPSRRNSGERKWLPNKRRFRNFTVITKSNCLKKPEKEWTPNYLKMKSC